MHGPKEGITDSFSQDQLHRDAVPPFGLGSAGWRGENGLRCPAVHPAERRAQKLPGLKKNLCRKMRNQLLWTTVTTPSKCYLGPVLIAGLNHFPLPANGMRNCTGFPGVLHPYLFRLVTDALPWKPALGKRKKNHPQYSGK